MKVRHKVTGAVYDNVRIVNGEWYIAENMSPIHAALRITDCDVIQPTEQWRDVTSEGYRLRKVGVCIYFDEHAGGKKYAYIVERKESHD